MARLYTRFTFIRFVVALTLLVGAALMVGDTSTPAFTKHDKAFYATKAALDYIRPGIVLKVSSVTIGNDGAVKVRFKISDPKGLPLDKDGVSTPGAITFRYVLAYIGRGLTRYVAYTKSATSGFPGTDSTGTYEKIADGEYIYTLATKVPADYDKTLTHTLGMQVSRNLSEFEMGSQADNDVFSWVPNGSPVTVTRDIVRTATCNQACHDPLSAHGSRRKVEYCVLCHQPDLNNRTTGNNSDFPVMVHRIHMGAELPSVKAGTPYKYGNTDFSTVGYPAGARNCETCHDPNSGAKQADAWLKRPSRAACGSCHDNVNFATGEGHLDLPQISDNQCANCHVPQGELEYDASIRGAHLDQRFSKSLAGIQFEIVDVFDGSAGKRPTVAFKIRDKVGDSIAPSTMTRLSLLLAGPTMDYQTYVSEDARQASGSDGGPYYWTFANPLPANAKGSFTIGIEGYKNTVLMAGTKQEATVRDAGQNRTFSFSVDGSAVEPRREVVSLAKCNQCHYSLSLHGGNRNTVEQCVLCHNPALTETGRPGAMGKAQSLSFRTMIHGIHGAEMREGGYVIYGRTGTKYDYSHVGYPGDLRNCQKCHINGTEQPPMPETASSVNDPKAPINPVAPITAACTACHNSVVTYSHALANTNKLGEGCAACHAAGMDFSVDKVHAR